MKLTKQLEKDTIEAYNNFWVANLSANMELFASYLVDDFSIFGSANGETFFNKQDAIEFYTATADEMRDKAQLRNRKTQVRPLNENNVIMLELSDLFVLIDDSWTFYGHARISCVITRIGNEWKAVHQHASFPDHRTVEGQQLATEKIERENLELKEAVHRRTVELEVKNRELEIEAAVERVRAQSMAMHDTHDLAKVTEELFTQLKKLNIEGFTGVAIYLVDEEDMVTTWDLSSPGSMSDLNGFAFRYDPKMNPVMGLFYPLWREGKLDYFVLDFPSDQLLIAADELEPVYPEMAGNFRNAIHSGALIHQWNPTGRLSNGVLSLDLMSPPTEEVKSITLKMSAAFNLAYQRFLDLQKAEAQAREARIETALEKVRSRSMGMQNSNELQEVIKVVFEQFIQLNILTDHAGFIMDYKERDDMHIWLADKRELPSEIKIPYFDSPHWNSYRHAKEKGLNFFSNHLDFGQKNKFYNDLFEWFPVPEESRKYYLECAGLAISTVLLDTVGLYIENFSGIPYSEDDNQTLMRFGKVFQQTYTRFHDLQKAEAQTREAQVELALERIRARVTSMKVSNDLLDIVVAMRTEFVSLGHEAHYFWHMRRLPDRFEKAMTSGDGSRIGMVMKLPRDFHAPFPLLHEWETTNDPVYIFAMDAEVAVEYVHRMVTLGDFQVVDHNAPSLDDVRHIGGLTFVGARTTHGEIGFSLPGRVANPPADAVANLIRFAAVFDLAYRRFEDLKSSEKQIRETQIELALERVRARTMAMQHSDELADASFVLDSQVRALGIQTRGCAFNIYGENESSEWFSSEAGAMQMYKTPREDLFLRYYEAGQRGEQLYIEEFDGPECQKHYEYLCTIPVMGDALRAMIAAGGSFPERQVDHATYFKYGYLLFVTLEPVPDAHDIFIRFAKVFEQTYTRFLDLQKAEAQTREAQIEASLERVRAKAMAMHVSDDLHHAVAVVFEELAKLNLGVLRVGISVLDQEKRNGSVWLTSVDDGKAVQVYGDEPFDSHPLLQGSMDAWINQEDFYYLLEGEDLTNYYQAVEAAKFGLPQSQLLSSGSDHKSQSCYVAVYNAGGLFAFMEDEFPDEAKKVLRRFAAVFDLTYKRYKDLQHAEAQAKEAQIEAALERVRSRTLAMQKSDELVETAAVLFQQLIALNIEPNRLYTGIIRNEDGDSEFWVTDEDGSSISTAFSNNMHSNRSFKKILDGWKQQQRSIVIDMQGEELKDYLEHLNNLGVVFKGGLQQKRRFQEIAYFSKGFIGIASPEEQSPETLQLLERFAAVFNLTFTRFNDLQVGEAHAAKAELDLLAIKEAKQKAEETLLELQTAQRQLIQSEKMASLGELTAGIAHEIQNPLNFVNNFSEVSKELLDEMKIELENGHMANAMAIMNDIIQNLEKINHHGKRADGIVKGMLQHSKGTSAGKEMTDMNQLADEYLRLCYHGLRAKDNSFSATIRTDFDASLPMIKVIPQDIGRVLLNVLTNAFYAANERRKSDPNRESIVSISTKKINDTIAIRVSDNGTGISPKIIEKIFQPFFTTKPTGQGTGLGLSLSYDIITKGHGGELKVETKEGVGSDFIIVLPIQQ